MTFSEQSIDGVIRQMRALFNDSGGRNMPRVLAAFTGFWPTVLRRALFGSVTFQPSSVDVRDD